MQRDTCALMFFPVRETARHHAQLPPLPRVDRAGCSPCAGAAARGRGVAPLPPLLVLPGNTCCAGSFDAWLVDAEQAGGECFLCPGGSIRVHGGQTARGNQPGG